MLCPGNHLPLWLHCQRDKEAGFCCTYTLFSIYFKTRIPQKISVWRSWSDLYRTEHAALHLRNKCFCGNCCNVCTLLYCLLQSWVCPLETIMKLQWLTSDPTWAVLFIRHSISLTVVSVTMTSAVQDLQCHQHPCSKDNCISSQLCSHKISHRVKHKEWS